jgi:hypothetical protein
MIEKRLRACVSWRQRIFCQTLSEYFKQASACDLFGFDLKATVASVAGSKTIFLIVAPHAHAWGYTLPPASQAL